MEVNDEGILLRYGEDGGNTFLNSIPFFYIFYYIL